MRMVLAQLHGTTKRDARYPRTNELKQLTFRPPSRPQKFKTWLASPLQIFVGRFRRLRREMHTKPVRVQYYLRKHAKSDAMIAEELGLE